MLHDLKKAGYAVEGIPQSPRELLDLIERGDEGLSVEEYRALAEGLPAARMAGRGSLGRGGSSDLSPPCGGDVRAGQRGAVKPNRRASNDEGSHPSTKHFPFRAARFGNVTVALAPDRGRSEDRRADYHDPKLPPRHELVAFGLWLQKSLGCHALVHVGAHGTLEWLPGKTVALSENCFPEIVTGGLPVVYPFIVSNPGEAAQAKRRIAAVTIGHLPPPLDRRRARRTPANTGAAGRRIRAGRRPRPPPPRQAGKPDRRDRAPDRARR